MKTFSPSLRTPQLKTVAVSIMFFALLGLSGCGNQSDSNTGKFKQVHAQVETEPVAAADDAADDPAIWVNREEPAKSRILGTNKKLGLGIYDLEGRELQFLERGRLNNVDIRQQVILGNKPRNIAVATNRTNLSLDLFEIEDSGYVQWVLEQPLPFEDPYGVCMYQSTSGELFVFANDKNGTYQQWQVSAPRGPLKLKLVREFKVESQPEGCAADDATDTLYLGEEQVGIWQMAADPAVNTTMQLLDHVDKGNLVADVEGMDVYRRDASTAYLVVSSQGDFSYAVYDLTDNNAYLGSFKIIDNRELKIDGVEETDGLAVTATALGDKFPNGMLVVQDGFNQQPDANQNFKLLSWADIAHQLRLKPDTRLC